MHNHFAVWRGDRKKFKTFSDAQDPGKNKSPVSFRGKGGNSDAVTLLKPPFKNKPETRSNTPGQCLAYIIFDSQSLLINKKTIV